MPLVLSFIFGAVIGSFLNVVSLRFNTGVGLHGRSKCMSCSKTLTWKELVPVFSFLAQKGACRTCKSKISWQYPLVELLAGIVFACIIVAFPPLSLAAGIHTVLYLVMACLLLVICVYDIKHKIIPDGFVYGFDALALCSLFFGGLSFWHVPGLWAMLAGPILALPFALIWLGSKGQWMGLGDAKLVLGLGWLLGLGGGVNAIVLAFWIAAAVSLLWIAFHRKSYKPRMEVPFGPYLILGLYLVFLFHIRVIDISLLRDLIL